MHISRSLKFIAQFVSIGLAAAIVLLFIYPFDEKPDQHEIVEIKESQRIRQNGEDGPDSYASAVEQTTPAVVNIYTRKNIDPSGQGNPVLRHFFGSRPNTRQPRQETSLGSGVIISSQGYILTNHHVINGADEIEIAMTDGRTARAQLIGADPDTDLAVLHIKLENLPVITIGQYQQLRVGDTVLAIGNPFGVGQTVTSGIISATGRNQLGISTFENFIQTDAAINPGNSGGALVNAYGELIGINTAIYSKSGGSQGIGFAIPVHLAKDVMIQIIEQGEVIRGWLGIAIQPLTPELAESFQVSAGHGVIVSNIILNGPADKAELTRGDVITHINKQAIHDTHSALNLISQSKPGEQIELQVIRAGEEMVAFARVGKRPGTQD